MKVSFTISGSPVGWNTVLTVEKIQNITIQVVQQVEVSNAELELVLEPKLTSIDNSTFNQKTMQTS